MEDRLAAFHMYQQRLLLSQPRVTVITTNYSRVESFVYMIEVSV